MAIHGRCANLVQAASLALTILYLHICITSAEWQGDLSVYELASFDNPDILDPEIHERLSKFNHFALNDDIVYVGGVNWLYRLTAQLEGIQNATTCEAEQTDAECRLNSNHNKILVVDTSVDGGRLITCGSEYMGTCQLRSLTNIAEVLNEPDYEVAGDEDEATVSLIARNGNDNYLYVAVSSTEGNANPEFHPLTRRSLIINSLFESSGDDLIEFSPDFRRFSIKYVTAFSYPVSPYEFTYFVTSQRNNTRSDARFVSKISRVCQDHTNLESYTEITIECSGSDGSVYSLVQAAHLGPAGSDLAASLGLDADEKVLYAVFAKNDGADGSSDVPIEQSALCVYRMTRILDGFKEAVRGCIKDGDRYSASQFAGSGCSAYPITILDRYLCFPYTNDAAKTQLYRYAKGIDPVVSVAVMELQDILPSSIITNIEETHTVAFIGTSHGHILKVHIESTTTARLYEQVPLDSVPVLADVNIDEETGEMHVLTEQKLIKMRVENCSQYTTCEKCIGTDAGMDGDPYCGWCTLDRKCTRYSNCFSLDVSTRWLAYNAAQCIEITAVTPYDNLPITVTEQQRTLTVQQLPDLATGQTYECHFGEYVSLATKNGDMLKCTTPPSNGIPAIEQGGDAVPVVLSVFSTETSVQFIDTEFYFYECSVHDSCVSCVGSRWACDWCVFENRCTHDSSTCIVQNEIIVTGENNPEASASSKGPEFCPQLLNQTGEVLIPDGIPRGITTRTKHLPEEPANQNFDYECSLIIEGQRHTTTAVRNGDSISCAEKDYVYSADVPELIIRLTVEWIDGERGRHILDDIPGYNVTLYKCGSQRPDCSRCVVARPELDCIWCGSDCKLNEICTSQNPVTLTNGQNCPIPVLTMVFPLTGPIEGNTILAVMGTDIGRRFEDVIEVTVGGQPCDLDGLNSEYKIGQSVSCRTRGSAEGPSSVTLIVRGEDGGDQTSSGVVNFMYMDPMISQFSPRRGPETGGTAVSISGTALNTGRYIQAFIGDKPCRISSNPVEAMVVCITNAGSAGKRGVLKLSFDGANRTLSDMYEYTENPVIKEVHLLYIDIPQPLASIVSGGRTLIVEGTNLNTPLRRQIVVDFGDGTRKYEDCKGTGDMVMECLSPNISAIGAAADDTIRTTFGFVMDGVTSLLSWSVDNDVSLLYVHDPKYVEFPDGITQKEQSILTLEGERIDAAITEQEIRVWVGTEICEVRFISESSLRCALPDERPSNGDFMGSDTERRLPVVWVVHSNVRARLGYIVYPKMNLVPIIVPAVSGAVVFIILLVGLGFGAQAYGAKREARLLQEDMVALEAALADEVRQAFVELQTDMTDLNSDLEGIGMPFVSRREYATKVLFTGQETVPCTEDEEYPDEQVERAMVKFSQLLSNKSFLLLLIQSLDAESSSKLSIRDKQSIASLLSVLMILENKLVYITDVMFTLMTRLIEDATDSNRTRQLFCRTESILEKLISNWVALCLYDQLKNHTAYPLFVLYRAIKYRSESGPIDAINGLSRFSLNYERLLEENVDFETLTLIVLIDDGGTVTKEVKVLDVDTISQVKEKILDAIHCNKPYSRRPGANQVSLEWRHGRSGKLVLTDMDLAVLTGNWRRISMLKDFHVTNNAQVSLVEKMDVANAKLSDTILKVEESATYDNVAFDGARINKGTSRQECYSLVEVENEEGVRNWHLTLEEDLSSEEDGERRRRRNRGCLESVTFRNKVTRRHINEIAFPRLLSTKGIVQEYVDNMFQAILSSKTTPKPIKYLFDFFESQAYRHDLSTKDADLVHIWKSNILPLRFWANAIKHPDYIFDIRPSNTVEASLDVIGQLFHDAHDTKIHKLGRETSFSKLLYSREKMQYRTLVDSFYEEVNEMPPVSKQELNKELYKACENFTGLFSKLSTLHLLWQYVRKFKQTLLDAIEDNERCKEENLDGLLEEVDNILSGDPEDAV